MSIDLSTSRLLWTGMASHLIGDCFDLAKPFIDQGYNGLDPHVRFVSTQLSIDCHLSSESVLLLVRASKEWDAEIVARSVVEGTLKYCYMLEGTESETEQRATEFWDTLPSYVAARRSDRAKKDPRQSRRS